MISNAKDQVSISALLRSKPVPSAWVATFGWYAGWALNQENGWLDLDDKPPMPAWEDIEEMVK